MNSSNDDTFAASSTRLRTTSTGTRGAAARDSVTTNRTSAARAAASSPRVAEELPWVLDALGGGELAPLVRLSRPLDPRGEEQVRIERDRLGDRQRGVIVRSPPGERLAREHDRFAFPAELGERHEQAVPGTAPALTWARSLP